MKWILYVSIFCACLAGVAVAVPALDNPEQLLNGALEQYRAGRYDEAEGALEIILNDGDLAFYHPEAFYWIAQINISQGNFIAARQNLLSITRNYPGSQRYTDAFYHAARLNYYTGNYHQLISELEVFRQQSPNSQYVGNSYYWSGLGWITLGEKEKAAAMFQRVVYGYPTSYRVDAAQYQLSLLNVEQREESLLDVVRWSQEEYLALLRSVETSAVQANQAVDILSDAQPETQDPQLLNEYRRQVERLRLEVDSLKRVEIDDLERGAPTAESVTERSGRLEELRQLFDQTRTEILRRIEDQSNDQLSQ